MVAFVLGEDDYRHNGTTRWAAYRSPGGALGEVFVATVAVAVLAGVLIAVGALSGKAPMTRGALILAAAGLLVFVPLTVEFSAN